MMLKELEIVLEVVRNRALLTTRDLMNIRERHPQFIPGGAAATVNYLERMVAQERMRLPSGSDPSWRRGVWT